MRLTILALALAASSAHAITPPEPAPAPAPAPAPVAAPAMPDESHSTSSAGATAGAVSGSVSGSTATGGTSSAMGGSASTGSSTSATANTTSNRALGLGFPSINFGSASTSECIVGGPSGGAIGWNFAATTKPAAIEAPVCSLRALAREAAAQCQWRTAALLRAEAARRVGIEPPPVADALRDVDPSACMQQPAPVVMPAPVIVPAPAVSPVTVLVSTEVEQAAPVAAPKRAPKGKPSTCPPGQRVVQVCEAPK